MSLVSEGFSVSITPTHLPRFATSADLTVNGESLILCMKLPQWLNYVDDTHFTVASTAQTLQRIMKPITQN